MARAFKACVVKWATKHPKNRSIAPRRARNVAPGQRVPIRQAEEGKEGKARQGKARGGAQEGPPHGQPLSLTLGKLGQGQVLLPAVHFLQVLVDQAVLLLLRDGVEQRVLQRGLRGEQARQAAAPRPGRLHGPLSGPGLGTRGAKKVSAALIGRGLPAGTLQSATLALQTLTHAHPFGQPARALRSN